MNLLIHIFFTFFKIGAFSFGGGYAMIPLMKKEVVTMHSWLTLNEMIDIIAVSQMTPGPVAVNLATFVGYKIAGFPGSVAATIGVVMPSLLLISILVRYFIKFKETDFFQRIFCGIRPVVVALVLFAAVVIGQNTLLDYKSFILLFAALTCVYYFRLHPIIVIFSSGFVGMLLY